MQMSRSIVISPNEIAHFRFARPPALSRVFLLLSDFSICIVWAECFEVVFILGVNCRLCVAALLLHLLHGGDGRNESLGTRAHRQHLHLQTWQEDGSLEIPILHGPSCRVGKILKSDFCHIWHFDQNLYDFYFIFKTQIYWRNNNYFQVAAFVIQSASPSVGGTAARDGAWISQDRGRLHGRSPSR